MAPGITEISSVSEFDSIVKSLDPAQLLVVDFHATWCGPCHAIAPVFANLATQYPHAKFVKVDVDRQPQLAQRFAVRAMPTFKLLKAGREVAELKGASPPQLMGLVKYHAGTAPPPKPAASSNSSGSKPASSAPTAPADTSLLSTVTSKGLSCLNESADHPLSSIVGPNAGPKGRSYLESDVDPELLISIPFNETVKLKSISIFGGVSPAQAPKTIKLFINHVALDFSDAETLAPAQELVLKPDDVKGDKIELRFVRFQTVRSLHILVKDNQEDEETTRIDSIDLFGTVVSEGDKGRLQKIGTDED